MLPVWPWGSPWLCGFGTCSLPRMTGDMSEEQHQIWLADWLNMRKLLWCHPPNGGHRNKIVGAKLKAQGVKRGVPDVIIFDPPPKGGHVGAAVELKAVGKGRATQDQKEWLRELGERGWATTVVHGWTEAVAWLESLGY